MNPKSSNGNSVRYCWQLFLTVTIALSPALGMPEAMPESNPSEFLKPGNLTPDEFKAVARNVRKTFYWDKKDLVTYVALTKHLLATAFENSGVENEHSRAFGERVVGLGYDLASMTWPGWDEEGIAVTDELQQVGLAAARMIVRVADEHDAPAEVRHNNYWILGAHLLASGDPKGAKKAWQKSMELHADHEGLGMLAWMSLADVVNGDSAEALDDYLAKLDAKGGPLAGTASQIRTARGVFLASQHGE